MDWATENPVLDWYGNKLPAQERAAIIKLALEKPELSPRELAVTYIDEQSSFVSESSVYRLLKAHDLITSLAYILMQSRDKFQHPTMRVNEMWETDFTYFKITGGDGITCRLYWTISRDLSLPRGFVLL